jgi:serine/threonine protein kinase
MMLESGQELSARFILVRRLGTGGSGEVWLAQDRERGCFVALKILRDDLMQDVAAIAALQRESEQIRTLDHPNILRVDGVHRTGRHTWIAMEYASGGDLSQLRGRGYREILLHAALPITAALEHAHHAGIVHRDVKPSNVLLASDGSPRLADFGMALVMSTQPARNAGTRLAAQHEPTAGCGRGCQCCRRSPRFRRNALRAADGLSAGLLAMASWQRQKARTSRHCQHRCRSRSRDCARLLAESPADRPADMASVERELAAVLATPLVATVERVHQSNSLPRRIRFVSSHRAFAHESRRAAARRVAPLGAADFGRRRTAPSGIPSRHRRGGARSRHRCRRAVVFFVLPRWFEREACALRAAASSVPAKPAAAEPRRRRSISLRSRAPSRTRTTSVRRSKRV